MLRGVGSITGACSGAYGIAQDGLAHESLSAEELLYLTIAYDWLLFRSVR